MLKQIIDASPKIYLEGQVKEDISLCHLESAPVAVRRVNFAQVHRSDAERVERDIREFVCIRDRVRSEVAPFHSEDGDTLSDLQSRIAAHYGKLVETIARRFRGANEPFEDMVQEGYLGLLSAMDHFSLEKNVLFSTYAAHFISGSMRHCLRDRGKIIKEPAWLSDLARKIETVSEALTQSLGRAPDFTEIADALGTTEDLVVECLSSRQLFRASAFGATQDDPDERVSDGVQAISALASESTAGEARQIEDRVVLGDAVVQLKELEKNVLLDFYYNEMNQVEIAKKHGISGTYAAQILKNATGKLRRLLDETEVKERSRTPSESAAIKDVQSGLFTEEYILSRCDEAISRVARARQPLAVVVFTLKLDAFPPGARQNAAWTTCGNVVRDSIRRVDSAGRLGGDRILVALPEIGADVAKIADRLKHDLLRALSLPGANTVVEFATAIYPDQGRTSADLVAAASAATARRATAPKTKIATKIATKPNAAPSVRSEPAAAAIPAPAPSLPEPVIVPRAPISRAEMLPRSRSERRASRLLAENSR